MIKYLKMKKQETEFKLKMYTVLNAITNPNVINNMNSLMHVLGSDFKNNPEGLKNEFIAELAKIVHETTDK